MRDISLYHFYNRDSSEVPEFPWPDIIEITTSLKGRDFRGKQFLRNFISHVNPFCRWAIYYIFSLCRKINFSIALSGLQSFREKKKWIFLSKKKILPVKIFSLKVFFKAVFSLITKTNMKSRKIMTFHSKKKSGHAQFDILLSHRTIFLSVCWRENPITNQIRLIIANAAFLLFLSSQSNTFLFAWLCSRSSCQTVEIHLYRRCNS